MSIYLFLVVVQFLFSSLAFHFFSILGALIARNNKTTNERPRNCEAINDVQSIVILYCIVLCTADKIHRL